MSTTQPVVTTSQEGVSIISVILGCVVVVALFVHNGCVNKIFPMAHVDPTVSITQPVVTTSQEGVSIISVILGCVWL